jgi:hypothetical protein
MDQKIFEMGLSVEGTSLYLLMVPLSDSGVPLDRENMARFWNASPEEMDRALVELRGRGVIDRGSQGEWFILPPSDWRREPA